MSKVDIRHWGDIYATEYSRLKFTRFLVPFLPCIRTGALEVCQSLVDDCVGADIICDVLAVAVVRYQLVL